MDMRKAIGGPYIAAHLRRRDFIKARENEVPSLKSAALQILQLLKKHILKIVFIATDAPKNEVQEIIRYIGTI